MIKEYKATFIGIILFTFFIGYLNGQTEKLKIKKEATIEEKIDSALKLPTRYSYFTADIYYGFKSFKNSFYNQLNNLNNFNLNSPVSIIGLGLSDYGYTYSPRGYVVFQTSLYYYLKNSITISDSISSKIKGFSYNFGFGKMFYSRKKRLCLPIYLGFNTGRLRLNLNDDTYTINPFFSPKLSIQPKVLLNKKIALSIVVDYEFDVSKTLWLKSNSVPSIINYNQSGLVGLISIGYCLKN